MKNIEVNVIGPVRSEIVLIIEATDVGVAADTFYFKHRVGNWGSVALRYITIDEATELQERIGEAIHKWTLSHPCDTESLNDGREEI